MQPLDSIFVRLVGRPWGKSMNRQVLWRAPVLEALSHVNQDACHPGNTLDLGEFLVSILQGERYSRPLQRFRCYPFPAAFS
jgi:hypothetical protein